MWAPHGLLGRREDAVPYAVKLQVRCAGARHA